MNKQQYLNELGKALKAQKLPDIEEILAEYEQHFDAKLQDGFSEEEIANKLERPTVIAQQFAASGEGTSSGNTQHALLCTGLGILDVFAVMGLLLLAGLAIVFLVFSIVIFALGICLVFNLNIAGLIPSMPYTGALTLGISCLGLGVLSFVGTIYSYLYICQWVRAYKKWHKNTVSGGYPSLPLHPSITGKCKRVLRTVTVISLIVFAIMFILSLIILFASVGFKPFWHELGWFV